MYLSGINNASYRLLKHVCREDRACSMEDLERFAGASVLEIGGRIMSLLAMGYIHSVKHPGLVDDIALDDLYMVTETGRDFVESRRRDDLRWWFTTAISVGALAVGITALMRTF